MRPVFVAIVLGLTTTFAWGHSEIETSIPAEGAVLVEMPETVTLNFDEGIRITMAEVRLADAEPVPVELTGDGFETEVALPVEDAGPGVYQVEWRGLSTDGHAMQGTLSFTVE